MTWRMPARRVTLMLIAAATAALLGACSLDNVPLPGAAPHGASYEVTAEFANVMDLVPQAAVRVNDVTVGSVEKIWLSGWRARVRLRIDRDVRLPANATAELRQSSLLGEKFVSLAPPVGEAPAGTLINGAVIPLARTTRSAEVEEVLAALGLLLNNGGLDQIKTINVELNNALDGRTKAVSDLLGQLDKFIGGLDAQKADITRAIDALDSLSTKLADQRKVIGNALDALGPGLSVLADQRAQLTRALTSLSELSTVGTRVVNASRDSTVASLKALRPILTELVKAGDDLPKSLRFMLSYPFPPNVQGAISANFVNMYATMDLDAAVVLSNLVVNPSTGAMQTTGPPLPAKPNTPKVPKVPSVPAPTVPGVPLPKPSLPTKTPTVPVPTTSCPLGLPIGC